MNLIGTALAGIYVVVATRPASAASKNPVGPAETGVLDITCEADKATDYAVSRPGATVRVTCPDTSGPGKASETGEGYIYFDGDCTKEGVLSNACPGATVKKEPQGGATVDALQEQEPKKGTIVTLWFPQLPASQQVVCVKCAAVSKTESGKDCKAVITVAAAPPQGPQACAVGGTSIMLEINKAGDSAQFKCGEGRTLAPTDPTQAYADDCSTVETLKDMTRSDKSESRYVTLKVDKLRKKKLCYLCRSNASVPKQTGGKDGPCKVYVQISGSIKFSPGFPYGLALPCLAAMLRFT